ncbi:PREDICTED: protein DETOXIFICATION 12-like isoform X1 [Tarenaya hassleriana]|uniref:protein DETOXIFICATION 12-like isoform X1 n=1 Tax=Tarenaya hassleriana TaxID=28532 RepID=UPI00053C8243|nr:PREDICTED: protein DETOXIFICATION 12-like isoform X1 [Tarenaya hassleriana]
MKIRENQRAEQMGSAKSEGGKLLSLPEERSEEPSRRQKGLCPDHGWTVVFLREVKTLGDLAAPMVAVNLSLFLSQVIPMMMVGHLGKLSLASSSLATSFCGVTGFSLLFGMASALETLNGQAYGAKLYRKLGLQTYTAILCLILACFPLSLVWINMGKLLVWIGQDPLISQEAGRYAACLIPGMIAYSVLQPLFRYFQTQSLTTPMLLSSCVTLCIHVPLCWVFVFKSGLGNLGGALAISLSYWLNVIFLVTYMKFSPTCSETRGQISVEIFHGAGEFMCLAVPSAAMICLEWWSYELIILLSGLLPNPQLETSVLATWYFLLLKLSPDPQTVSYVHNFIFELLVVFFGVVSSLQTVTTLYTIPEGLGAAASTRVSNEIGARNPRTANLAVNAAMCITVTEAIVMASTLFFNRHTFGYFFSNEKEVIDYVATITPLLCLTVSLDSIQAVLSGIARGCGKQNLGAWINLGAFYPWGIPIAATLAFWLDLRGLGLWIGIQAGTFMQTVLLSILVTCTNWEKQAIEAQKRMQTDSRGIEEETQLLC